MSKLHHCLQKYINYKNAFANFIFLSLFLLTEAHSLEILLLLINSSLENDENIKRVLFYETRCTMQSMLAVRTTAFKPMTSIKNISITFEFNNIQNDS